jgi:uncharacterized tellurite resistance protein B-like protein
MTSTEKALLQGLVHVIWADGEASEEERHLLGGVLTQLGMGQEQLAEVAKMMVEPPDLTNLKESVPDHEARLEMMKVMLAMALADGKVEVSELRFLNRMSKHLEISNEEMETLKRETMEAVDHEE